MSGRPLLWLASCFSFLACVGGAQAQERYPNRNIELVVPYAPGGTTDIVARTYSDRLATELNGTVTVVNRPGAGGIVGAMYVTRAKKDGYTLLSAAGAAMVIVPIITAEATFSAEKDFYPVGYFGSVPSVFVVRNDSPINSLQELVEYARKNPGKLRNAVGGLGTGSYCNLAILSARNKIEINTIPFKSGGETVTALLGGHVDMTSSGFITLGPHLEAGRLRGLAVTSNKRQPHFPNIPTTAEAGYPYVNYSDWIGVFAPAGIPQSVLNVLVPALARTFKDPGVVDRATKANLAVEYKNPEEFRKFIESENQTWGKVYKDAGLSKH